MKSVFGIREVTCTTSVVFLPMIEMPATDLKCVYSSLRFCEELAGRYGKTPVCTFDQALWWKALKVICSPGSDLVPFVIKLGPFHTIMNMLSCISYAMANTGLSDAFTVVYASNTVPHILSGKAVNRALRAHQLVASVLEGRLMDTLVTESQRQNMQNMVDASLNGDIEVCDLQHMNELKEIMHSQY